jgi:hypothetical protein
MWVVGIELQLARSAKMVKGPAVNVECLDTDLYIPK